MAEIRVLSSANRTMQRLGYLKRLVRRVVALSTSSLDNLGHDLVQTVMRRVRVPLTRERVIYVRQRLFDRTYNNLKRQASAWSGEGGEITVALELQDLYLADPLLPSQTGKLVRDDWRHYPPLGVGLGLVRAGTYSANTRGLSLLYFTSEGELEAFLDYRPETNPLHIGRPQALLFLYSLLENDGEVIAPLLCRLARETTEEFSEREAGDQLPQIYRSLIGRHRRRLLSADDRDRLEVLSRVADSIERWLGQPYTGAGSREHNIRVRLEPYSDIGLLAKPDSFHYRYNFSQAGRIWAESLQGVESNEQVADFLATQFFATAAKAWEIPAEIASDSAPDIIVAHLYRGWEGIQSVGGYAPIQEMALVAGIEALLDHGLVIEPGVAREAIIAYQKANPYKVRFTVNRMGVLAHARFLEPPADH